MWRRDLLAQGAPVRRRFGEAFGYFTTVPRVTWLILTAWFLATSVLFEHPSAVQSSRQEARVAAAVAHPDPARWGLADGMWMALRYHVPVISVGARGKWEPSDEPLTLRPTSAGADSSPVSTLGWWARKRGCFAPSKPEACLLPVTPEGYASFVSMLHWLIVPTILVLVSRRVLRRAHQNK